MTLSLNQETNQPKGFLEINAVRKMFGQTPAVDTFNLSVRKGEFISFLGPSGCGKTTTLRMIAGFEKPTSGQITIDGVDVTYVPANKRKIGMVFQSYALFPNMTVRENIQFGLKVGGQSQGVMHQRVTEMLDLIHLPDIGGRYPHQLSGGQQQRVALARALAIQPHVLLLDEPLSALDAKIRVSLRQEIRAIQRKLGITAIYVTHDQEEALSISDRIVVMNKGRMEQVGAPSSIYNLPQTRFVAQFVGTLSVLESQAIDAYHAQIDGQPITLSRPLTDEQLAKPFTIALRPESLSFVRSGMDNIDQLQGQVEDVAFLGSVVRIRVRLTKQIINVDSFNTPGLSLPEVGQPCTVYFTPDAVMTLDGE